MKNDIRDIFDRAEQLREHGELEAATQLYTKVARQPGELQARALQMKGVCCSGLKKLDEAQEMLEKALKLTPTTDAEWRGNILRDLGEVLSKQGSYDQAAATLEEAITILESIDHPGAVGITIGFKGRNLKRQAKYPEALELTQKAADILATTDNQKVKLYNDVWLANLLAHNDRADDARALAAQALLVATSHNLKGQVDRLDVIKKYADQPDELEEHLEKL